MTERPLLLPLVALMTGISATTLMGIQFYTWYLLPASLFLVFGILFKRSSLVVSGVTIIFLFWGGYSATTFSAPLIPSEYISTKRSDVPATVVGILYQRPQIKKNSTAIFIRVESINGLAASCRIMVNVKTGSVAVLTGDRIRIKTRLTQPRNYGIPGEYNQQRALAVRGIFLTGYLPDAANVEKVDSGAGYLLQRKLDETALWLCSFIDDSVAEPESGVLKALLVGERGAVPAYIEALYARTGVNHILSISGFHVGILAVVLYQLLALISAQSGFLLHYNIRWQLLLATLPLLVFYLLVSGAAPATVRSVLMIAACFVALLIERETDAVNVLALAALAILLITPGALFDISFQLSFIALWGILILTPIFMGWYRWQKSGALFIAIQFFAVSAAAIAATLLPVAYSFHRVSIAGLVSNFVVVPLLGYGAVVVGFTALTVSAFFPGVAALLLKLAALLVTWSNTAMTWVDRLPQLPSFSPSILQVSLSIAVLLALTVFKKNNIRLLAVLAIVLLGCFAGYADNADKASLKVTFFSVGQGESTLIRFTDGSNMLIDGGGALHESDFDVGERLLAPALLTLGVKRIDRMVLSHPHPDHLKGLLNIAANFPVGEFWESGYSYSSPDYLRLKQILSKKGVPVKIVNGGVLSFKTGSGIIEPLGPPVPFLEGVADSGEEMDANDESMVFRLSQGQFSMLFSGDSGFASEARLLNKRAKLKTDVLKVAHHGSRNSSSIPFLKQVSPKLALISAGYNNSFNLPSPDTVMDIEKTGSLIHRTDLDGTLELTVTPEDGLFTSKKYPPVSIDTH